MKKITKVDVPVYHRKVQAYLGFSYDEMQEAVKKEFGIIVEGIKKDEHSGAVFSLRNESKGVNCLMFWCNFPKDMQNFSHEVLHLTATIMQDAGVKMSNDSEEAWAYLHGYLFNKLFLIK